MLKFFNKYYPIRNLVFFIIESLLVFFSIYIVILLYYNYNLPFDPNRLNIWIRVSIVTFVLQVVLYYCSLYEFKYGLKLLDLFLRIVQAIGITCIILSAIYFFVSTCYTGTRDIFWRHLYYFCFFLVSWRILYIYLCQKGIWNEDIILLMDGELGLHIISEIRNNLDSGYNIKYIFLPTNIQFNKDILYDISFSEEQVCEDIDMLCSLSLEDNIKKNNFCSGRKEGCISYKCPFRVQN